MLMTCFRSFFICRAISSFKILRQEVGEDDGYIRINCKLTNSDIFEFSEYIQLRTNRINIETYSFHWQSSDAKVIKRWDNVEHHKEIDTFPCHLHLSNGQVTTSLPMSLKKVLAEIEKTLAIKNDL